MFEEFKESILLEFKIYDISMMHKEIMQYANRIFILTNRGMCEKF